MRVLLVCMFTVCTAVFFIMQNRSICKPVQSLPTDPYSNDTVNFALQIQPILVNHCSPCHFTGGKMYEKMPFDKGETIVQHNVGLLRRINDEKEKAIIQKFIGEQKR